nr:hypothetical protein [uncultured Desulfosarcina sp.]
MIHLDLQLPAGLPERAALEVDQELDVVAGFAASPTPVAALAAVLLRPDVEPVVAAAPGARAVILAPLVAGGPGGGDPGRRKQIQHVHGFSPFRTYQDKTGYLVIETVLL